MLLNNCKHFSVHLCVCVCGFCSFSLLLFLFLLLAIAHHSAKTICIQTTFVAITAKSTHTKKKNKTKYRNPKLCMIHNFHSAQSSGICIAVPTTTEQRTTILKCNFLNRIAYWKNSVLKTKFCYATQHHLTQTKIARRKWKETLKLPQKLCVWWQERINFGCVTPMQPSLWHRRINLVVALYILLREANQALRLSFPLQATTNTLTHTLADPYTVSHSWSNQNRIKIHTIHALTVQYLLESTEQ